MIVFFKMEGNDFMSTTVSFRANATPQEKAAAKANAKASLANTAITAAGGVIAGGAIGGLVSFLPANPLDKVIEGMHSAGDSFAKEYVEKKAEFINANAAQKISDRLESLKKVATPNQSQLDEITGLTDKLKDLPDPKNLDSIKAAFENAKKTIEEKAAELIKNSPDCEIVKTAKKAAKSMMRPERIAKGACYGLMAALLLNIISSFRKPKAQSQTQK